MMLNYCEDFAGFRGLIFNASKTQLISFGPQPSTPCSANIRFFDATLPFCDVVVHLGHLLCHDLSDSDDILSKAWDLIRKANLMLYTFSAADPVVKSRLLQSYCLSLYGSALWKLLCPAIHSIEVSLTTYSDASGIFHAIATPEFYTLLLACPVCLMLSFLGQHPFCHLPSPALLSLFGKFLVNLACWLTHILGIMPCLVAYMPSNTIRRMGCVLMRYTPSSL